MTRERNFVRGAMLLAGAAVLTKLLGSVYTIVLQNIIGDHGMGLFQMAYPIYATLLAIATAGFPVAISKIVSERLAVADFLGARQTFRVSFVVLSLGGVFTFSILFFGAPAWARIAGDPSAVWSIQAIAPALLIVPVMSVLRGYFQGYQWMEPTAYSQILEQFIRVATILGLAVWFIHMGLGVQFAAAGAAFGAVTGALAALLMLIYYWLRKHPPGGETNPMARLSGVALAKQLVYYAFPISLGALVVPLMNNVDVVTVVNLLKHAGESQNLATTEFGLLSGRAFKLMMLPTTLAAGIGIAVMPAVSEAFTLGFRRLMSERIDMAIRLTMLLALPAAAGLILLAEPIDVTLFRDNSGTTTIQIIALATVFASLQTTVAAVLQGAGWVYLPVLNLLLAGVVKLVANLLFVPVLGIRGAALATVVSYAAAAFLNFAAMGRTIQERIRVRRWFINPLLATFVMSAVVFALHRQWVRFGGAQHGRLAMGVACIGMVVVGGFVYAIALMATGSLDANELEGVPRVGPRLVVWFRRLGLLK